MARLPSRRRDAEDAAAFAARRARREDGAVRRLRHAGFVPRRHHGRAPALPRSRGVVRRLPHGPASPRRRRRRGGARDAGTGRRRRPGRRQAALRALYERRRRHPGRPDGDAPRGPSFPRRQRRLQGGRHRPPARNDCIALPHRADARPCAARAAGSRGGCGHRPSRAGAGAAHLHDGRRRSRESAASPASRRARATPAKTDSRSRSLLATPKPWRAPCSPSPRSPPPGSAPATRFAWRRACASTATRSTPRRRRSKPA